VAAVNDARKRAMARKVAAIAGNLRGKTIAIFGLTFKRTPMTCAKPLQSH
jgi:UDPglucose 6-dehydrogenase